MLIYFIALYAFLAVGWDTWDIEAFNPFSDFTQQGLAVLVFSKHPALLASLAFLTLAFVLARFFPKRRRYNWTSLLFCLAAIYYALFPSFFGVDKLDLGLGSFIYVFAVLGILGRSLANRGWLRGDPFTIQSILFLSCLVLLFIFFPLFTILKTAFVNESGWSLAVFTEKLGSLHMLESTFWNTLKLALIVSTFCTLIGTVLALLVVRSRRTWLSPILKPFSMLPMITPPFVVGLSLIFLFGRAGAITNGLFGINENYLIGLPGIAMAQIACFTPISYMIIVGVLEGIDATLEEASFTLQAGYFKTLKLVTWKLMRPGLANSFLLTMIESFADFANPVLIGGDYHVLSTEIYFSIMGKHDEQLAATLGVVLLVSTMIFFGLQHFWLGKKSYVTVTGKPQARTLPGLPFWLDNILMGVALVWIAITVSLYLYFFYGGFVKIWGIDHALTLTHYKSFMIDGWDSFKTTMVLAFISAPLTAILGLLLAYIIQKKQFMGKGVLEFVSLVSFAVPGTVVGIGYLLAFHNPPFHMTGTAAILVFCFMFRNMPIGMRAGVSLFSQIDPSLEEASLTLRANTFTTLRKVMFPLAERAVVAATSTSFIRAVTAVSAVVFLVSARYNLATKVILDRIEYGKLGVATAYATVLVVVMALVLWLSDKAIQVWTKRNNRQIAKGS